MTGRERIQGYHDAHRAAGLAVNPNLIQGDSYNRESGQRAINALLSLPHPPTAIFASSGILGEVALSVIMSRKLRIPNDISFIMFDDVPWATLMTPSITVVSQPTYSLGAMSFQLLHQRLQNTNHIEVPTAMKIIMKPELILRESCLSFPVPQSSFAKDRDS
jgi:DNA-binding LacI/PurR family transcriptional regulator